MTWEEMTPEQRDAYIAEKVMGYTVREVEYQTERISFWEPGPRYSLLNEQGELAQGYKTGKYSQPEFAWRDCPHYTTSMDAAWAVIQKMSTRWSAQDEYVDEPFARFVDGLLPNSGGEIWTAWKCMAEEVAKWTPERICHTAYEAVLRQEVSKE